jgi:hypothetical protein
VAYLGWRGPAAATPWPSARRGLGKRWRDRRKRCGGGGGGAVRGVCWMEVLPVA